MRISENKMAHIIERPNGDDILVIMDESTGEEIELVREEFMRVLHLVNFPFNLPAFKERLTL